MKAIGAAAAAAIKERQRQSLRRNRILATGLLVVAAAVFAATGRVAADRFWLGLLHAGAEAAVVGGLADWFAVTALFRHPLGLPIPHTAVIPKNKDRIGEGLGHFVERNFLAPGILAARLRAVEPARRLADWLADAEHADLLAGKAADALPHLVNALGDREIRQFAARSFGEQLRETDLAPVLGRALTLLTDSVEYDALFDRALDAAQEMLGNNADRIYGVVTERSQWWIPKAVDRHIAEKIITAIEELLVEMRAPESDGRTRFRATLDDTAAKLVASPDWRARVKEVKDRLLERPEMQAWLGAVWDDLRRIVVDDLALPRSRTRQALRTAMLSLGRTLAADASMRTRIDEGLEHVALSVVPWRGEIARLIAEVVRGWDARTVSQRLELALGSDLQYIRINGTLVGACAGALLYLVSRYAF